MRSVFSIGFLCLILLPHVGMWELWPVRVMEAKREAKRLIKHGIPKDEQIHFRFSLEETQTQLKWKHSREFQFEGEMYDILRTQLRGDSVWYWCYHDKKETEALRSYEKRASFTWNRIPKTDNRTAQVYYFFHHLFSPPDVGNHSNLMAYQREGLIAFYSNAYTSHSFVPLQPPPELHLA